MFAWRKWVAVATLSLVCLCAHAQGKRGIAVERYSDPETGVSFEYPSAWTAKMGLAYGDDPLREEDGKDHKSPPQERLRRGWEYSLGTVMGEEHVGEVSFAYALIPVKTDAECAARFSAWGGEGKPDTVVIHGVSFYHVPYTDAGLGHSWSFELYTTFQQGRCLGFSVGSNASRSDEPFPMTDADRAVSRDAEAVMKTVRLR
jgi:hypothetical protein